MFILVEIKDMVSVICCYNRKVHLYMFPDSSSSDPTEQAEPVGDLPQGELWSADVGGAVPRPYV